MADKHVVPDNPGNQEQTEKCSRSKLYHKMWVTSVHLGKVKDEDEDETKDMSMNSNKNDLDYTLFVYLQEGTLVILVIDDGVDVNENSAVFEIPTEEFEFEK
jgi:hypothetical protein